MAGQKHISGKVQPDSQIRRSPLVGMGFLHRLPVGERYSLSALAKLKAKDLIGLLFSHYSAASIRARKPRVIVTMQVRSPQGKRPVSMVFK